MIITEAAKNQPPTGNVGSSLAERSYLQPCAMFCPNSWVGQDGNARSFVALLLGLARESETLVRSRRLAIGTINAPRSRAQARWRMQVAVQNVRGRFRCV
jgi:hypothetical protein